jgi:hypothetical protein
MREAELRAPTGWDEVLLSESRELTGPARIQALLRRCITRVGPDESTPAVVGSLTAGDQEAVLLQLRAVAFGDRLPCVVDCSECGERLDVQLSVHELLLPPYPDPRERYATTLSAGEDRWEVSFRLPTGADLESAAASGDVESASRHLLDCCINEATIDGRPEPHVPAQVRARLSEQMASLDPQAELRLLLSCPVCEAEFTGTVEAATLILADLTAGSDRLFREVHALARSYHWSESEILGLDVSRRRRYLELLADETEELAE